MITEIQRTALDAIKAIYALKPKLVNLEKTKPTIPRNQRSELWTNLAKFTLIEADMSGDEKEHKDTTEDQPDEYDFNDPFLNCKEPEESDYSVKEDILSDNFSETENDNSSDSNQFIRLRVLPKRNRTQRVNLKAVFQEEKELGLTDSEYEYTSETDDLGYESDSETECSNAEYSSESDSDSESDFSNAEYNSDSESDSESDSDSDSENEFSNAEYTTDSEDEGEQNIPIYVDSDIEDQANGYCIEIGSDGWKCMKQNCEEHRIPEDRCDPKGTKLTKEEKKELEQTEKEVEQKKQRKCGNCGKVGHNKRTCQVSQSNPKSQKRNIRCKRCRQLGHNIQSCNVVFEETEGYKEYIRRKEEGITGCGLKSTLSHPNESLEKIKFFNMMYLKASRGE